MPATGWHTRWRSEIAMAAKQQKGAGIHKDRRFPRGGAKNQSRDLEDQAWSADLPDQCMECDYLTTCNEETWMKPDICKRGSLPEDDEEEEKKKDEADDFNDIT